MLLELNIENFALIDRLTVQFGPGFNVLTGETGAGKSIVIDAINAILGERMGADMIRSGAARATVEAAFDLSETPERAGELALESVLDPGETLLAVSRDFSASGKSQARVGGRLSSMSYLRDVGRNLVDVHGQHEHQSLLHVERHVDILDDWCGKRALDLREECASLDRRKRAIAHELSALRMDEREKAQRLDLLRFQIEEIDEAGLSVGEEADLLADRSRLANMERLVENVGRARSQLVGGDGEGLAAVDVIVAASRLVNDAARDDPGLSPISETLRGAVYTLQDAVQDLAAYHEALESDPHRLEEIEDRLAALRSLKRKYGDSIEEILSFRHRNREEIAHFEGAEEREAELSNDLLKASLALTEIAGKLSEVRREGAAVLEKRVAAELADLSLAGSEFLVDVKPQEPESNGGDRVEFMFSANPGEPARPLARIASGGEMSRIMLALKSLLASAVGVPTVIFDEIDVGVGGRTGEFIGDKLAGLGGQSQVICVTHLPQVASMADHHFCVRKEVVSGRATVRVRCLSTEERVEELSRMLGGGRDSAGVHARDLLARRQTMASNRNLSGAVLELGV